MNNKKEHQRDQDDQLIGKFTDCPRPLNSMQPRCVHNLRYKDIQVVVLNSSRNYYTNNNIKNTSATKVPKTQDRSFIQPGCVHNSCFKDIELVV